MSEFVDRYLLIPPYLRGCGECHARMPFLTVFAPIAAILGWKFCGYIWLCPKHSADAEVRARFDAKHREILRKAGQETKEWRQRADRELTQAMSREHARSLGLPPQAFVTAADAPYASAPAPRIASGPGFSLVLVIAEEAAFPLAEQLEQKLIRQITAQPRYPVASDVRFVSLRVPQLPSETGAGVQALVGNLQKKYQKSGKWQTDFYPTPIGVTFLVAYLE